MFNLVQFVENHSSSREIDQKKEKFAEENHDYPVASQDISSQPSMLGEKDKEVAMTKIPSEQKPIATREQNRPLAPATPISGKEAVTDLNYNPSVGRNQAAPKPLKPQTITRIPRPFSKIAYKRNTGIEDNNLLPYTNTEDTELLAKLGYSADKDLYLFLPRGEEKEDLYSYVEKVAGVSKDVARCIDQGTAFSSEHLKDMDYEVPEGYEIKGDLVAPIEKKANALVVSGIHGDEPAGDKAAQKLKDSVDVVSDINPSDKRRFEGKDINRHFDKPTEGKAQKTILDIIRKKKPSKVIALHEDDEVDKPYAYSSEALKDDTREALKEYSTASSAHGDKTEDGVISRGKNPPDGSLEKALDDRDIPRVTIETPSKAQDLNKRVDTQLDVVKKLLNKKAEATHELKSSNLKAVGYDKENKKLEVAFRSGGNYTYNDVPKSLFDRIKRVKSPGKFFHKHIKKDNKFEYNKLEKESSVLSSHPGTVTNLEAYQPPEMSKMDIVGSLLLGENYIPQRREYESIYESTQRSKRNTDYLTHHPLLTDSMSKNLSNVFGGDVNKAYKDVSHMLSDPEVMSQFKQAESIFDRLEKKIYLEMQNER